MAVPLIGLTGGIGAGKSTALQLFRELGAETLSSDEVVHELYGDHEVRDEVVARWGEGVAPDGSVDRSKVAEIAFGDPAEREWLEGLIWPRVGARIERWTESVKMKRPPPRAAVLEVPLLFESGLDAVFDATIAVVAAPERVSRRTADRGLVAVERRQRRQLSQREKAARASFVVENDGSVEELRAELSAILGKLQG